MFAALKVGDDLLIANLCIPEGHEPFDYCGDTPIVLELNSGSRGLLDALWFENIRKASKSITRSAIYRPAGRHLGNREKHHRESGR